MVALATIHNKNWFLTGAWRRRRERRKRKLSKEKKLSIKRKTAPVKNKVKGAKATKAGEEERGGDGEGLLDE